MKVSLTDLANLENEASVVSSLTQNNNAIETAMDNTLSRDGSSPNEMEADLDMNGNAILNLPTPTTDAEPATKGYVDLLAGLATSAAVTTAVQAAQAAQAAAEGARDDAQTLVDDIPLSLVTTSGDSITPTVGSQAVTVQASKAFAHPMWVYAQSDSNSAIWFSGPVTSYVGTTLTVDVQAIGTASAKTDWTIVVSGRRGPTGATGADYTASNNLNALHGVASNGLYARTGSTTASARTITGTSNRITVTNGDGVSGNPTIDVGSNILRADIDNTLASRVALLHTEYSQGTTLAAGTAFTTELTDGKFQSGTYTSGTAATSLNLPSTGVGEVFAVITNTTGSTRVFNFQANGNTVVRNLTSAGITSVSVATGKILYFQAQRFLSGFGTVLYQYLVV